MILALETRGSLSLHSQHAICYLKAWVDEHISNPYPKPREMMMLSKKTGLTWTQVKDWFQTYRHNHLKPVVEGGSADDPNNKILVSAILRKKADPKRNYPHYNRDRDAKKQKLAEAPDNPKDPFGVGEFDETLIVHSVTWVCDILDKEKESSGWGFWGELFGKEDESKLCWRTKKTICLGPESGESCLPVLPMHVVCCQGLWALALWMEINPIFHCPCLILPWSTQQVWMFRPAWVMVSQWWTELPVQVMTMYYQITNSSDKRGWRPIDCILPHSGLTRVVIPVVCCCRLLPRSRDPKRSHRLRRVNPNWFPND
jgi:Homeobox KN domain